MNIENNLILFDENINILNRQYELNNNGEIDHGVLINRSKMSSSCSNKLMDEGNKNTKREELKDKNKSKSKEKNIKEIFTEEEQDKKSYDIDLLYEAISEKCGNKFLTTHKELIEFSKENDVSSIHVDYNTLRLNNEKISDIEYPISNIHYPLGIEVCLEMDVSLENYDNLNINEIKEWVKK